MMLAARAVGIGAPAYTESLGRERAAVPKARRLTVEALACWSLDVLVDDAALVCSELVTNAVVHARGTSLRLTVTRRPAGVRIAVTDCSRIMPALLAGRAAGMEHGRGLVLVDTLAVEWGTDRLHWGKRVWAHLDVVP
jgi:anti-sigma regulatory factor (Ser/Thr protein kinase)